jgi:hypothetical protein
MGRAVCVKNARTDLWEPRVGNRPGRPGASTVAKLYVPAIGVLVLRGVARYGGGEKWRGASTPPAEGSSRRLKNPAASKGAVPPLLHAAAHGRPRRVAGSPHTECGSGPRSWSE